MYESLVTIDDNNHLHLTDEGLARLKAYYME